MRMETYNKVSTDNIHKYTLNMPKDLYQKAKKKANDIGIYSLSIYFRAILERELNSDDSLSIEEIIKVRKQSLKTDSAKHRRKRLDNIEYGWFKRNFKKILDKLSDRQYTWF